MGVGDDRSTTRQRRDVTASAIATVAKGSDRIPRQRPAPATVKVDDEEISGLLELAEVVVSQKPPPSDVLPLEADDKKTRKMDAEQFKALLRTERAAGDPTTPVPTKLANDLVAKTVEPAPAPRKATTTAELMAQVDDAFADFGPEPDSAAEPQKQDAVPVEAPQLDSKPIKKQALVVADHRYDTRFAAAHAPITKPPATKLASPAIEPRPSPRDVELAPATSSSTRDVELAPATSSSTRDAEVDPSNSSRPIVNDVVAPANSMLILVSVLAIAIVLAIAVVLIR